ncbi:trypsin-like serine peptidase [Stenotrophomonas sp. NPDC077464]|uniref:trypsin-like serine peptidase n=1 Tax=unclassified Stenotrophomonas TaxID=196198 RepID=UPI0037CFC345
MFNLNMFESHRSEAVTFFLGLPSHTLEQCVAEVGLFSLENLIQLRKELPEDPLAARVQLIETLIDKHASANADRQLLDAAARHVHLDPHQQLRLHRLLEAMVPHSPNVDAAKQAAIAKRDHTLPLDQIGRFFQEISGKLCLVVAAGPGTPSKLGTGFLIGPDLILTSYHLLKDHIRSGQPIGIPGSTLLAVFDYHGTLPFDVFRPRPAGTIEVPFAEAWLIAHSEDMPADGTFRIPTDAQLSQLPHRLDFAVVRLADKVGLRPRVPSGGPRRMWCELPATPQALLADQHVIIPQHPHGWPRRVSFGRYCVKSTAYDTSNTRLRYDCETDQGTSGAPCFNAEFKLIGMHNATFAPDNKVEANQAIRAQLITDRLTGVMHGSTPMPSIPLWNVSSDPAKPRPVFGRRQLVQWIEDASCDNETARDTRCYVVKESSAEPHGGTGLSFSAEILQAARSGAGSEEPVVLLGVDQEVPTTAEDFLCTLANHLRIDARHILKMPSRPTASGAAGQLRSDTDLDKVNKWLCDDLPQWLNDGLGAPLQPDATDAEAPRFRRVWIVVDGLNRRPMDAEVEDLIAGLMRGADDQSGFLSNLTGFRWMFLGRAPRPALSPLTMVEILRPSSVGEEDARRIVEALSDSGGWSAESTLLISHALVALVTNAPPQVIPAPQHLQYLQAQVSAVIVGLQALPSEAT